MSAPVLSLGSIALVVGIATVLLLIQPLLLGASASMAGQKAPGWFKALLTLIVAGLGSGAASLVYSVTFGWMLSGLGTWAVVIGGVMVSWLATSVIYSAILRISIDRAALVAGIYWLISGALSGVVVLALKLFLG